MQKISFKKLDALEPLWSRFLANMKKIPWILGENAFLVMLVLIFLGIFIGQWLLYNYVVLVKLEEPSVIMEPVSFNKNAYREFLAQKEQRADELLLGQPENIPNPFR